MPVGAMPPTAPPGWQALAQGVLVVLMRVQSRPWAQRAFIAACVVAVAVQWVAITQRRTTHLGDFDV